MFNQSDMVYINLIMPLVINGHRGRHTDTQTHTVRDGHKPDKHTDTHIHTHMHILSSEPKQFQETRHVLG